MDTGGGRGEGERVTAESSQLPRSFACITDYSGTYLIWAPLGPKYFVLISRGRIICIYIKLEIGLNQVSSLVPRLGRSLGTRLPDVLISGVTF